MIDNIREKVVSCLSNVGIEVEGDDINLLSYLQDSLVFVSFVVELEEVFQIEFDDASFVDETFSDMDSICNIINVLLNT
mgnify:CR=1 FL=1